MRILRKAALAAIAGAAFAAATLAATAASSLSLLNSSGETIVSVEARAPGHAAWRDLLRSATVGEGREVRVDPGAGDECLYDLRIGFADGSRITLRDVDACEGGDVTVFATGYAR